MKINLFLFYFRLLHTNASLEVQIRNLYGTLDCILFPELILKFKLYTGHLTLHPGHRAMPPTSREGNNHVIRGNISNTYHCQVKLEVRESLETGNVTGQRNY